MDNFVIDKLGNGSNDERNGITLRSDDVEENNFLKFTKIDLFDKLLDGFEKEETKTRKRDNVIIDNIYLTTSRKNLNINGNLPTDMDKLLEKSVIQQGFEQFHFIPSEKTKRSLILKRKKLREKTKGKKWFDIPATELTEEIKTDFELLKMRSVLDRKHVYKKNDIIRMPKYFQIGKVIESPADFYNGRIVKSQRKKTMVDELLADAEFRKYQKKKFKEIMAELRRKKRTDKVLSGSKVQKKKSKR